MIKRATKGGPEGRRRCWSLLLAGALLGACGGGTPGVEERARAELREQLAGEEADSTVRSLYERHDHALMWVSSDGLTREGERIVKAIETAEADGLDPDAFGLEEARAALEIVGQEERPERERAEALARAELALTLGFADLVRDLTRGTSEPSDVAPGWRITQDDSHSGELIGRLGEDGDAADLLVAARPAAPEYERLGQVLERLYTLRDAGGWPVVPDRDVEPGTDHRDVAALRARLRVSLSEREREDASAGAGRPTYFDERLAAALRSFQTRHGLEPDGRLGRRTAAALNVPVEARIRAVELNLERWRWMPHDLGERAIFVNVPGYDLDLLENGEAVFAMKTVVGNRDWPTPVFSDTMTHMVVHPYWNVPESILADELLPNARANEDYLAANNYEVVDAEGRLVEGDLELDDLDPELGRGLRVRQRPGTGNALGQVKFMFPNRANVYLHDTPARALFDETDRAFSHGCIRVERPLQLARYLLEWTGGDPEAFDEALEGEDQDRRLDLPHGIPVYIAYLTVRVQEDGTTSFLPDPYGLDREMDDLLLSRNVGRLASAPRIGGTGD